MQATQATDGQGSALTNEPEFRSDFRRLLARNCETRPAGRLRVHFDVERALADRLRHAPAQERPALYGPLYAELFASLPDHPQHRLSPERRSRNTELQVALLARHLCARSVFVEIGCGDAEVTRRLCARIARGIAVDVTDSLVDYATSPPNFEFLRTDGLRLDLADASADLVYSNQLMEHLHPDDATTQLREIGRILRPGGAYICITPNRLTGPHDISVYFSREPTGFHLREYDHASLTRTLRDAGFRTVRALLRLHGRSALVPVWPVIAIETTIAALHPSLRDRLMALGPLRNLAGVCLVATR